MSGLACAKVPASLVLRQRRTGTPGNTCFLLVPASGVRDAPIVIAMHGMDRAAAGFRDVMTAQSIRNGQIVLVPEFDAHQFPDFYAYNFGGVRLPPPLQHRASTRALEFWQL